jgi:hypothetical protein
MRNIGSIRQKECLWVNRRGETVTVLLSAEPSSSTAHRTSFIRPGHHRAEAGGGGACAPGEARLRESEARFSAAFQGSPAFLGILRMDDEKYVLANDSYLNWLGYPLEGSGGAHLRGPWLWETRRNGIAILQDMFTSGSIRHRECRWRNRSGKRFTILLSAEPSS